MRYFCLFLVVVLAPVCAMAQVHSADQNADYQIDMTELLRVIQFQNILGYHCDESSEDGYAPGWIGDQTECEPHSSDYNPQNWRIELPETLRAIQFFNIGDYYACAEGEDGFCPGVNPGELVILANWLGFYLTDAQPVIEAQGFVVNVTYEYNEVVPAGIITGQDPSAGLVSAGSTVDLVVSDGPNPGFEATLETTDPDTVWSVDEIGHFQVTAVGGVPPYSVNILWPDAGFQTAQIAESGGSTAFSHLWVADTGGQFVGLVVRVKDSSSPQLVLNLEFPIRVDPAVI